MDVVTKITFHIFIRISRLHHIDSRHQACFLVNGITVDNNILDYGTEFLITTRLQP